MQKKLSEGHGGERAKARKAKSVAKPKQAENPAVVTPVVVEQMRQKFRGYCDHWVRRLRNDPNETDAHNCWTTVRDTITEVPEALMARYAALDPRVRAYWSEYHRVDEWEVLSEDLEDRTLSAAAYISAILDYIRWNDSACYDHKERWCEDEGCTETEWDELVDSLTPMAAFKTA